MTKPASRINWMTASDDPTKIAEPSTEKKGVGWLVEKPPFQFFNWAFKTLDLWLKYFEAQTDQYDVVIGSGDDATHASLAAAIADVDVGDNITVLIRESIVGGAVPTALTKFGWRIYARPGVTFTKGTATTGLSVEAAGIEIHGLRFEDFSTGGDIAIEFTADGDYGRVMNCNFASCDTEIDDDAVAAGRKPFVFGSITE